MRIAHKSRKKDFTLFRRAFNPHFSEKSALDADIGQG
jgi:hypothetical protein